MSKSKKAEQLGMNPSTASNRLKKLLLFEYVKKAGDNICHQCGLEIENIEELSVEHKVPWLDSENPKELYFDLDNISFSHLKCNIAAARTPRIKAECPSATCYRNGCRCDGCKEAQRLRISKQRKNKKND